MSSFTEQLFDDSTQFGTVTLRTGEAVRGLNPVIDHFYAYWCQLCRDHGKPMRKHVHPKAFGPYLDRAVIIDIDRAGDETIFTIRLIGTFVTSLYGELSGKDLREMPNPSAVARISYLCNQLLATGVVQASMTTALSAEKDYMQACAVYLPLYDADGRITKIMVGVDAHSRFSPPPEPRR